MIRRTMLIAGAASVMALVAAGPSWADMNTMA